jgi:hypothetical protein
VRGVGPAYCTVLPGARSLPCALPRSSADPLHTLACFFRQHIVQCTPHPRTGHSRPTTLRELRQLQGTAYSSNGHRLEGFSVVTNFERERRKFGRERYCLEALARLLPPPVDQYRNPLDDYARETGVDVIAVIDKRQIGFQVTEYDGGEGNSQMKPGHMRAAEVKQVREAGDTGVYGGWGSPHVEQAFLARIAAKVRKSLDYDFAEYDEVWLLVCANIPGAGLSTFVPHFHIGSDDLNQWTAATLASSKYARAFFHVIMGDAVFGWDRVSGWRKLVGR